MKNLSFLINILFFPFEILGAVIVRGFIGLRTFIRLFFLSPWGLLIPLSLIAFFVLFELSGYLADSTAARYETELQSCEESKVPDLFDIFIRLENNGIPPLVRCLGSQREKVFTQAGETLYKELERWNSLPSEQQAKKYRIFTENLSKYATDFSPAGQVAAVDFAQKILRELVTEKRGTSSDFYQVAKNCEQLLTKIETARKKKIAPTGPFNEPDMDSLARFKQKPFEPTLMANSETPFEPPVHQQAEDIPDSFAASRSEILYAYHQSPQFQTQKTIPEHYEKEIIEPDRVGLAAAPVQAAINGKIADNYIHKHQPVSEPGTVFPKTGFTEAGLNIHPVNKVPFSAIPNLPTEQLMRMLHDPNAEDAAEARKTLIGRDGFREPHLKLAYRLFHSDPCVREEVLTLLPVTAGTQPNVWLSALLNDPDNNIRYRAASALATAGDPSMLRLVIDKAKRDSDARITRLADQLLEQQGNRVRR